MRDKDLSWDFLPKLYSMHEKQMWSVYCKRIDRSVRGPVEAWNQERIESIQ
jgi:hypothetical protein